MEKRSGFSMIELVFVIVILGVLAAVAVPRFVATRTDAQVATARSDLASAMKAIVAKVFADNIDATQSSAPDPNIKVKDQTSFSLPWGKWIVEVAGLDEGRWRAGAVNNTGATLSMGGHSVAVNDYIQPIGNKAGGVKGGCGGILGIETGTGKGNMIFHPGNQTLINSGGFCEQLSKSYANSNGSGNRVVPLATTGTIDW